MLRERIGAVPWPPPTTPRPASANRQIAEQLGMSEWTVDRHVRHILTRLELRSLTQVATWAIKRGLVTPNPP